MTPEFAVSTIALIVAATVVSFFYLRYRARLDYQQTVRLVIEEGRQLTPEFLAGWPDVSRYGRYGLTMVLLSIGLGWPILARWLSR
jgi:hypothetical protein